MIKFLIYDKIFLNHNLVKDKGLSFNTQMHFKRILKMIDNF